MFLEFPCDVRIRSAHPPNFAPNRGLDDDVDLNVVGSRIDSFDACVTDCVCVRDRLREARSHSVHYHCLFHSLSCRHTVLCVQDRASGATGEVTDTYWKKRRPCRSTLPYSYNIRSFPFRSRELENHFMIDNNFQIKNKILTY